MHSDWFELFDSYWWLIFPVGWMIGNGLKHWLRHQQARRTLDLIKGYADQGKDPPAELLNLLQQPVKAPRDTGDERSQSVFRPYLWVPVFLFGALSLGFAFMAWQWAQSEGTVRVGLVFVAIVMAGLALGNLVAVLGINRNNSLPK